MIPRGRPPKGPTEMRPDRGPKPKAKRAMKRQGARGKRLQPALDAAYAIAKARSNGRCQAPGCPNEATEVHHLRTRSAAAHLRENAANLAHLCNECHELWQPKGATFRQIYAAAHPYFAAVYNDALDVMKVGARGSKEDV